VSRTLDAAAGRWPELLQALGGLTDADLCDREGPCPSCAVLTGDAGNTRFKWDDDSGNGGWFCSHCGGKDRRGGGGTGVDLLMRVTGWDLKQALGRVEQHLGLPGAAADAPTRRPRKPKRPHRIPDAPPAGTAPPALGSAVAQFPYGPDRQSPWYWIQRVPLTPKPDAPAGAKPPKLFIHRTWLDGAWHYPRKSDPFSSEWPSPRPVFNLPDLNDQPDAPVLISEGEGKSIAAASLFPERVSIAWTGGTAGIGHTDWAPLAGRDCLLWPDADDAGRACMAKLAQQLIAIGCTVRIVNPPNTVPAGWDLADAAAEGWAPQRAAKAVERYAKTVEAPPAPPAPPPDRPLPEVADIPRNAPFICLGFDGDNYYYQPNATGQITRISRGNHTETHLLTLCSDLGYWEALYQGSKAPINWTAAKAALFAAQHRAGIFNPECIRGRGAWWDDGRAILHLGDRLIVDGQSHSVMKPPPSRFKYQRLVSINLPTDLPPLTDHEGVEILDIASRFHWEVPASGLLIAGWAALAPICGSLSWRPHLWLTAAAGSGKSALLGRFLGTLLQEIALWPEGTTTEASIRQELRQDARAVIMDEAESNEQADRKRIQDILALARVASSTGRGFIGRGGSDGTAQRFTARAMFLLCSINTAIKQGADASRFAALTLRNPSFLPKDQRTAHWRDLDRDLEAIVTPELGHRMILRSVELIPVIRDSVAVFRRAAADRFDSQRTGDQYGTLLAGAWSLMSSQVAAEDDAYRVIDSNDWQQYREDAEQPDEDRCLQQILQHQLRVEIERLDVGTGGGRLFTRNTTITRTVWELVEAANGAQEGDEVNRETAEVHLGRIGIRVDSGRLLVSNSALGIRRILGDTPWAHNWAMVLSRLPGAEKAGKVRFKGMSTTTRAASLPMPSA
jgi:putative DNA primase/helicase